MRKLIILSVLAIIFMSSAACNSKTDGALSSSSPANSSNNNPSESKDILKKSITNDNDFLSIIDENDKLLLKGDLGYLYCTSTSSLKILESIEQTVRPYQIFLSDDGNMVYYSTNSSSIEGKLAYYDVKNNKYGNLLEEMGIDIQGYVCLATYKSDNVVILVGGYDENKRKVETDTLIEINLKEKRHKIIKLPFTPSGAMIYNGLSYFGDNIGILCSSKEQLQEGYEQVLVILSNDGKLVNNVLISEKDMICNISSSPDGSKFTYQTGTTPTNLNLYDIKDGSKKLLFSQDLSEENGEIICISSIWGNKSENLYYETCDIANNSEGRFQLNRIDSFK